MNDIIRALGLPEKDENIAKHFQDIFVADINKAIEDNANDLLLTKEVYNIVNHIFDSDININDILETTEED